MATFCLEVEFVWGSDESGHLAKGEKINIYTFGKYYLKFLNLSP